MTTLNALYSSPWVPAPLVEACGFTPQPVFDLTNIDSRRSGMSTTAGVCPWCRLFCGHAAASSPDITILATTCDQMRRSAETLAGNLPSPVFVLTVPSTNTASASRLYHSELVRLAKVLTGISGVAPTEASLREAIVRQKQVLPEETGSSEASAPICLLGNHLPIPIKEFQETLRKLGGSVLINGLESGSRCQPDMKQILSANGVPAIISAMAESYFFAIKDISRRPNSDFYRWLSVEIKKHAPKGILLVRNSWCDQWALEAVRLRNWSDLPLLELEFGSADLPLSSLSRIEAFIETCTP